MGHRTPNALDDLHRWPLQPTETPSILQKDQPIRGRTLWVRGPQITGSRVRLRLAFTIPSSLVRFAYENPTDTSLPSRFAAS